MTKLRNVCLGLVMTLLTALIALAQPKGPTVTVKGEAVDLWCYMEGGDRGPAKKDCATACAKAGNAIGIVDAKGMSTLRRASRIISPLEICSSGR